MLGFVFAKEIIRTPDLDLDKIMSIMYKNCKNLTLDKKNKKIFESIIVIVMRMLATSLTHCVCWC